MSKFRIHPLKMPSLVHKVHLCHYDRLENPIFNLFLSYLSSRDPIQALERPFLPNYAMEVSSSIQKGKIQVPQMVYSMRLQQKMPIFISSMALSSLPRKLALHKELLERIHSKFVYIPTMTAIQYHRLCEKALNCVNSLLCQFFWPCIDGMEE